MGAGANQVSPRSDWILHPKVVTRPIHQSWVSAAAILLTAAVSGSQLVGQATPVVNPSVLQREAIQLLEKGQAEEAVALLEPAVGQQPRSSQLLALLGMAQFLDRRYLAAEDSLRGAVELGQRDVRTFFYLSSVLWENGKLAQAEETCRRAIDLHGQQLPVAHLLGRLYLWQARYDEAVEWLEQTVSQSSESVDLWLDLAGALEGAGRQEGALQALGRAVELAPEHYQVRYGLARLLAKSGDQQAAQRELTLYRRLLQEDQQRTLREGRLRAQVDLGYDLLRQGEASAAAAHLEALPLSVEVLVAQAAVWQQLGDRQAALLALEQAVALDPGRDDLRARLAAARFGEETPE